MPIPTEINARLVPHRERCDAIDLGAVRIFPVILAPRRLLCEADQVPFGGQLVHRKVDEYVIWRTFSASDIVMNVAAKERELIERTKRFIKAELKRADVTYEELAERLREHGLEETKGSIAAKISRGAFPATFFIAVMKAIGRENINLVDV